MPLGAPPGYEVIELPGLGKAYRCLRCGAILVSDEDIRGHGEYHARQYVREGRRKKESEEPSPEKLLE